MKDLKFAGVGWLTGSGLLSVLGVAILVLWVLSFCCPGRMGIGFFVVKWVLTVVWSVLFFYNTASWLHLV